MCRSDAKEYKGYNNNNKRGVIEREKGKGV